MFNSTDPKFLIELASVAKRNEEYWNAASADQVGDDPVSRFSQRTFRNRASEFRGIYHDAMAAADGCEASARSLDEYLDGDHLLLVAQTSFCGWRAAA